MQWDKGYTASYYMTEVDPFTWADMERFEIVSGSITRSMEKLRQSADVECVDYPRDKERWVRIYLDARQSGSGTHEALFTGLATSPDRSIRGSWTENRVQCYSVLKPADDIQLMRGYYAATGASASYILRDLLTPVPAPLEFVGELPALEYPIVAESGETNLTMVERILQAINWNMRIKGDGHISFEPYSNEPIITFDPLEFDVLETEITIASDWYSCPNVFMASSNGVTAIVRDNDPDSPMSIQNRGREVWASESGVSLSVNETLYDYTARRLKEEQEYLTTASYSRRFVPSVFPGDMVKLHYPKQELDGDFMVTNQSIELGYSARTSEEIAGVM